MLRNEFLDVCGKLLVVCDELGVCWCMGLNGTDLRRRCSNDGWDFLNVKSGFDRIRS